MGFLSAQNAIEGLFHANWSHTVITHDGEILDVRNVSEWVRIAVREGKSNQASLGVTNPMFRYFGILFVQIFVRNNTGTGRARELADLVTPIFRSKIVNGIHYGVPEVSTVGPDEAWFQVNVSCEFYREEF